MNNLVKHRIHRFFAWDATGRYQVLGFCIAFCRKLAGSMLVLPSGRVLVGLAAIVVLASARVPFGWGLLRRGGCLRCELIGAATLRLICILLLLQCIQFVWGSVLAIGGSIVVLRCAWQLITAVDIVKASRVVVIGMTSQCLELVLTSSPRATVSLILVLHTEHH